MNKSQIRFAMAAHAAWLVMKNPVLTRVYMLERQLDKNYKFSGTPNLLCYPSAKVAQG